MADREVLPELWCDFNGRVMSGSYWLGAQSTIDQLAMLGLTLESAVGRRFTFNGGDDCDESNVPAEILCNGTIEHEPGLGCFVARVDNDFYWRPKRVD